MSRGKPVDKQAIRERILSQLVPGQKISGTQIRASCADLASQSVIAEQWMLIRIDLAKQRRIEELKFGTYLIK